MSKEEEEEEEKEEEEEEEVLLLSCKERSRMITPGGQSNSC